MSDGERVLANGRIGEAPLIYFENVGPWSAIPGIVRIELLATILRSLPNGEGIAVARTEVAHLRCNVPAARMLIHALTEAIDMADRPPQVVPEKRN